MLYIPLLLSLIPLVSSKSVCESSCAAFESTIACTSTSCPPCRTMGNPFGFDYTCWDFVPGGAKCPDWAGIVDCSKSSPAVVKEEDGITIFNNCDLPVWSNNGHRVPEHCLNGKVCSDFNNQTQGFNLFVSSGFAAAPNTHTLVEIAPTKTDWWYDISKIKGFNFGASIVYPGMQPVVCFDINCPMAYRLCEIGYNSYNPVYKAPRGKTMIITFCPLKKVANEHFCPG